MKTYKNLYNKITSLDNLYLAAERASYKKKKRKEVKEFYDNLEANLKEIQSSLLLFTYSTSSYRKKRVYEPKERDIHILPFKDRVVHHALMNIIGEIFVKTFAYNQYSSIRGRGQSACAKQTWRIIRSFKGQPLYCLKFDIRKCYPSVNHDVLKQFVRKKIKDRNTLWLIDNIIDSIQGLPIGNYTSAFFCNLLFSFLIHYINEYYSKIHLVNYADDFCIFADNKETLHRVLHEFIIPYVNNVLKMDIKGNYQVFPIAVDHQDNRGRACDFIGTLFFRECKLIRVRIKQHAINIMNKYQNEDEKTFIMKVSPWIGHMKYTNSINLINVHGGIHRDTLLKYAA